MAELTVYPAIGAGDGSADGWTEFEGGSNTWAALIAANGTGASAATQTDYRMFSWTTEATIDRFFTLQRTKFTFDTSALGAGATISSAVLSIYGTSKADPRSNAPDINIYAAGGGDDTVLAADHQAIGSTALCDTPITYANWSTTGYNDFTLNATGLAAISLTGVSKFGIRNPNKDVAGSAPTWGAGSEVTRINGYFTEQGTIYRPKLVITYDPGTTTSTSSSTSTTSTSSSTSTTSTSSSTSTTSTSSSSSTSTSTSTTSTSTSSSTSTTTTSTSSSTSSSTSTSTTTTWIYPFIVDSGLASNQAEMSFTVDVGV